MQNQTCLVREHKMRSPILVSNRALNPKSCHNPLHRLLLLSIARRSIIKLNLDIVLHEPRPTLDPLKPSGGGEIAHHTLVVHHRDLVILVELVQLV